MNQAGPTMNTGNLPSLDNFSDADFRRAIWNSLRMVAIAAAISVPVVWWKLGWQSAALLAIGALISGSGLFEWLRLMTAVATRMDSSAPPSRPLAGVLTTFFLRLALAVVALYVSLKFLHGSVFALIAGLAFGVAALSIEGLRLVRSWTV
jgi:hypothetical protein